MEAVHGCTKNVTVNRPVTYYPDNESNVTRFEGTNVFNKNFDTTQNYRPFRPLIGNSANDFTISATCGLMYTVADK